MRLAGAAVALVVASGWWVAIVQLTPAADRPYIGGSQDNSVLNLIFGYNGFGRLTGAESGSVGGAGAGSRWGATGWDRLFNAEFGGQISWLIPAAVLALVALLVLRRRAPRTDRVRAAALLWGGWLLVTAAVFSYARGIVHPYYSIALAPAIAALVAIGAAELWARRRRAAARLVLAAGVAVTATWAWVLLDRSPGFHPWLRAAVLAGGLGAAGIVAAAPWLRLRLGAGVAAAAVAVILAGPAAYALDTAVTPHSGAIPSAGPAVSGGGFGPGGVTAGRGGLRPQGGTSMQAPSGASGAPPNGASLPSIGGNGALPGAGGRRTQSGAGPGGILDSATPPAALVKLLSTGTGRSRWVAATVGSNAAAAYQLATDRPVMAIAGSTAPTRRRRWLGSSGTCAPATSTGSSRPAARAGAGTPRPSPPGCSSTSPPAPSAG